MPGSPSWSSYTYYFSYHALDAERVWLLLCCPFVSRSPTKLNSPTLVFLLDTTMLKSQKILSKCSMLLIVSLHSKLSTPTKCTSSLLTTLWPDLAYSSRQWGWALSLHSQLRYLNEIQTGCE